MWQSGATPKSKSEPDGLRGEPFAPVRLSPAPPDYHRRYAEAQRNASARGRDPCAGRQGFNDSRAGEPRQSVHRQPTTGGPRPWRRTRTHPAVLHPRSESNAGDAKSMSTLGKTIRPQPVFIANRRGRLACHTRKQGLIMHATAIRQTMPILTNPTARR